MGWVAVRRPTVKKLHCFHFVKGCSSSPLSPTPLHFLCSPVGSEAADRVRLCMALWCGHRKSFPGLPSGFQNETPLSAISAISAQTSLRSTGKTNRIDVIYQQRDLRQSTKRESIDRGLHHDECRHCERGLVRVSTERTCEEYVDFSSRPNSIGRMLHCVNKPMKSNSVAWVGSFPTKLLCTLHCAMDTHTLLQGFAQLKPHHQTCRWSSLCSSPTNKTAYSSMKKLPELSQSSWEEVFVDHSTC